MTVVAVGADWASARPTRAMLSSHAIQFACRYLLDDARNRGKALKSAELANLTAWGIPVVANFEYAPQPVLTAAQGATDARTATAELKALGAPDGVPVYFSFDYGTRAADYPGVRAYLTGAESVLGQGWAGAYGHYGLIEYLAGHGIGWLWQTYAWSYFADTPNGAPYTHWSGHATIRQVRNGAFAPDFDGDLDHAMTPAFGQWTPGGDMNLTDQTTVPADLVKYFPPELNVTAGTKMTVEELLWQSMMRGASAASWTAHAVGVLDQVAHAVAGVAGAGAQDAAALESIKTQISGLSAALAAIPGANVDAQTAQITTGVLDGLGRVRLTVDPPAATGHPGAHEATP